MSYNHLSVKHEPEVVARATLVFKYFLFKSRTTLLYVALIKLIDYYVVFRIYLVCCWFADDLHSISCCKTNTEKAHQFIGVCFFFVFFPDIDSNVFWVHAVTSWSGISHNTIASFLYRFKCSLNVCVCCRIGTVLLASLASFLHPVFKFMVNYTNKTKIKREKKINNNNKQTNKNL